jgi:hypothetical protein
MLDALMVKLLNVDGQTSTQLPQAPKKWGRDLGETHLMITLEIGIGRRW